MKVVWFDVAYVAVVNFISDILTLFYIFWTQKIIKWIIDPLATKKDGAILCAIFTSAALVACVLKGSIV